jgi:hypothetical protein
MAVLASAKRVVNAIYLLLLMAKQLRHDFIIMIKTKKHIKTVLALLVAMTMNLVISAGMSYLSIAHAASPVEYEVKAIFLYNFAKFVEWPETAFKDNNSPIIIGVIGKDPFGEILDKAIYGEKIMGRELILKRFSKISEIESCHILFIAFSDREEVAQIIKHINGLSVLTIAELEGFPQLGGIINFVLKENKIGFEINIDAAERAHLKISSKLLKLAKIIREDKNRETK